MKWHRCIHLCWSIDSLKPQISSFIVICSLGESIKKIYIYICLTCEMQSSSFLAGWNYFFFFSIWYQHLRHLFSPERAIVVLTVMEYLRAGITWFCRRFRRLGCLTQKHLMTLDWEECAWAIQYMPEHCAPDQFWKLFPSEGFLKPL